MKELLNISVFLWIRALTPRRDVAGHDLGKGACQYLQVWWMPWLSVTVQTRGAEKKDKSPKRKGEVAGRGLETTSLRANPAQLTLKAVCNTGVPGPDCSSPDSPPARATCLLPADPALHRLWKQACSLSVGFGKLANQHGACISKDAARELVSARVLKSSSEQLHVPN